MTRSERGSNGRRPYQKHGITAALRGVPGLGTEVLDGRTKLGKAAAAFRAELLQDLGGESELSAQEATILEQVVIDRLLLACVDSFLFAGVGDNPIGNILNKSKRRLFPLVEQRQSIAAGMTARLSKLGLKKRPKVIDLDEYTAEKYGDMEQAS